ncbi:MAG: flagellar export chaperone FliS [Vicinamibacterales bacterium]
MMHPGTAANQYLRTQVRSSAPLELVVLLYDAALRFTAAAREAMVRGDIKARRTAISKAMAVINELQISLDLDKGGVVAEELDRLYIWINSSLVDAVAKQDVRLIDDARRVLEILHDGWKGIAASPPAAAGAAR